MVYRFKAPERRMIAGSEGEKVILAP